MIYSIQSGKFSDKLGTSVKQNKTKKEKGKCMCDNLGVGKWNFLQRRNNSSFFPLLTDGEVIYPFSLLR